MESSFLTVIASIFARFSMWSWQTYTKNASTFERVRRHRRRWRMCAPTSSALGRAGAPTSLNFDGDDLHVHRRGRTRRAVTLTRFCRVAKQGGEQPAGELKFALALATTIEPARKP
jgi:hypothetical protein